MKRIIQECIRAGWIVSLALPLFAATSTKDWRIAPFERPAAGNPIIIPDASTVFHDPLVTAPVRWQALHTFNPAAVVRQGKVFLLYRAEDDSGTMEIGMHTSRLGLAESDDGIHFHRQQEPVFFPAEDDQKSREWPGGVEDPRLVEDESGRYILTYTQWNRKTYTVGIATSTDLQHWTKYGPAFGATGKYSTLQYKSAGIVTGISGGRLIAARIQGKFWMYWGEIHVHLATSDDLVHWSPVEEKSGELLEILPPRPGLFDSGFAEIGPPPVLTNRGIIVLYNGKNGDPKLGGVPNPRLGAASYAAGEALFSRDDPRKLLERADEPILYPQADYERTGQYAAGTTFAEGLVSFHVQWLLYYGCADSRVGVVTSPMSDR